MITGDYGLTAHAIAKEVGIVKEGPCLIIKGKKLNQMSDDEVKKVLVSGENVIFARAVPEHKMRIARILESMDEIVAMTGDGVNDAPALKKADIGVAMGITGTDVAKQASSMILMDDNFATIVYAVEEGRNVYNKIKRAVEFVLATNLGQVLAILIAILIGKGSPLGAIHVLWVNLIVESLIAIPISMDTNDPKVMNEKPRPRKETIFANMVISIVFLALSVMIAVLGSYILTLHLGFDKDIASSVAFIVMSTAPMLYVLSLRTPKTMLFKSKPWENMPLLLAIIFGILLNLVLMYSPINDFFHLKSLVDKPLMIAFISTLIPLILCEIFKFFKMKVSKNK